MNQPLALPIASHAVQSSAHGSSPEDGSAKPDWERALAAHSRWLRLVVLARVGEQQGVDEVLQEVALALVARHPDTNDPRRVFAWLYRVAIRQSLLYRRRLGRQRKLQNRLSTIAPSRSARDQDPLVWLLSKERHQLLREAVRRLSSKDVELLLLKYVDNWSARALADHLGATTAAIETRLRRLRQRLRGELSRLLDIDATNSSSKI